MIGKLGMHAKAKRLRVLHVIPSVAACRGGPSKAVIEMVSHLRSLDVDAEIATTNDDGPNELDVSLNTLTDYKGVPTRFFKRYSPAQSSVREFAYSGPFRRWLSVSIDNYDLIHVHAIFSYCSSYAMYLCRNRGIPYLVRPLGLLQHWSLLQSPIKKKIYLRVIERANIEFASTVHFTAESEMKEARELLKIQGHVLPIGVNKPSQPKFDVEKLEGLFGIKMSGLKILYLSRLHEKKGLELLMRALARIKNLNFTLLIAGDGEPEYKAKLISISNQLSIQSKCYFLGHVDGDPKSALLAHSDLYALTSFSENFGISVLEAMAVGLTPLISNQVALSNVVADNQLGLICSLDVDDIELKLRFALNNPEATKLMGHKAKLYTANKYSWPIIVGALKSLYSSLIK